MRLHESQPHGPQVWTRLVTRSVAVDVCGVLLVWALAIRLRTGWVDVAIKEGTACYLRCANEFDLLAAQGEPHLLLYTSIPFIVYTLVSRVFDAPDLAVRVWGAIGALASPLSYLAARRLAGPVAGFAVGVLVATSPADCALMTCLHNPGPVSTYSACAALGLAAGATRRAWGPPLLVFGVAMAVCHHIGLWMMAPAACLVAVAHLLSLQRRGRVESALVATILGGLIVELFLWMDAERLVEHIQLFREEMGFGGGNLVQWEEGPEQTGQLLGALGVAADVLFASSHTVAVRTRTGLNLTPPAAGLFLLTAVAGCACSLRDALRRDQRGRVFLRADKLIAAAHLQLLALIVFGLFPYLSMAHERGYLWPTHMLAFLPLMAVATAGAARVCASRRATWLRTLVPAATVCAWIGMVECSARDESLGVPPLASRVLTSLKPRQPWQGIPSVEAAGLHSIQSFMFAAEVSDRIRADARERGVRPSVSCRFDWVERYTHKWFEDVVQELSLRNWDNASLEIGCYLVARDEDAFRLRAERWLPLPPDYPFAVLACDSCGAPVCAIETPPSQ